MTLTANKYKQSATEWASKNGITLNAVFLGHMFYFAGDTDTRDVYQITLKSEKFEYKFQFGQSLADSKLIDSSSGTYWDKIRRIGRNHFNPRKNPSGVSRQPTMYDICASLTKNDPGTHKDFCGDFRYSTDSIIARDLYIRVQEEWSNVIKLCNWNITTLQELQEIS